VLKTGTKAEEAAYVEKNLQIIRNEIKDTMQEHKLSVRDLANSLGVTPLRLNQMLEGKWPMSVTFLVQIGYRLECKEKMLNAS